MKTPNTSVKTITVALILTGTTVGGLISCTGTPRQRQAPPTQADRLQAAYRELQHGRFAVIADFEDDRQMGIFQLEDMSGQARLEMDNRHGRVDTGPGCLRFTTASPDDRIIVGDQDGSSWSLRQDWRTYDLLLITLTTPQSRWRSEQQGLTVNLTVRGGVIGRQLEASSRFPLIAGHNLLRIDISEIGEHVPLDSVRELRLAIDGISQPTDIYIDDILLTTHRVDLFGQAGNDAGALYVQQMGKRWNVGAGGRFELVFANAQIVGWHNLQADPYRVHNLVRQTTLGPSIVSLRRDGRPAPPDTAPRPALLAAPNLIEANDVRIVIQCIWSLVAGDDTSKDPDSSQVWTYTIYPTGQIYAEVACNGPLATGPWGQALAVSVAGEAGDITRCYTPPIGVDNSEKAPHPPHAIARLSRADAALLYALESSAPGYAMAPMDASGPGTTFLATRPSEAPTTPRRCHMLLTQSSTTTDEELQTRAHQYAHPPALTFEIGAPSSDTARSLDPTGFDHSTGAYVVSPNRNQVRFTVDGRARPLFAPAFEVEAPEDQDAWVYVDHLIYRPTVRDANGHVHFQIREKVDRLMHIVVFFNRHQSTLES